MAPACTEPLRPAFSNGQLSHFHCEVSTASAFAAAADSAPSAASCASELKVLIVASIVVATAVRSKSQRISLAPAGWFDPCTCEWQLVQLPASRKIWPPAPPPGNAAPVRATDGCPAWLWHC